MARLVDENRLGEEWDPERHLLLPRPYGLLVRRDPCRAPGCPNQLAVSSVPLCGSHAEQFAHSDQPSVERWLQTADIRPIRPRFGDPPCLVTGANGDGCGRPAVGSQRLCRSHLSMWLSPRIRDRGVTFEELPGGHLAAGKSGRVCGRLLLPRRLTHRTRLCEVHDRYWKIAGRPKGRRFRGSGGPDPPAGEQKSPQPARTAGPGPPGTAARHLLSYGRPGPHRHRRHARLCRYPPGEGCRLANRPGPSPAAAAAGRGPGSFRPLRLRPCQPGLRRPSAERDKDVWDLRAFGRSGRLDFSVIGQVLAAPRRQSVGVGIRRRAGPGPLFSTTSTPWGCSPRC